MTGNNNLRRFIQNYALKILGQALIGLQILWQISTHFDGRRLVIRMQGKIAILESLDGGLKLLQYLDQVALSIVYKVFNSSTTVRSFEIFFMLKGGCRLFTARCSAFS